MRKYKTKLFIQLKNSRAFSLLEMLVALALFTFLFLFITQIVRQNHRQAAKIKKDLELTDSIYHVVNLIKEDLSSVTYFLDLSYNFRTHFPLVIKENSEGLSQNLNLTADTSIAQASNSSFKNIVLLDNEVVFKGGSQEMEFVSYSFSKNTNFKQWMKIRYAVEDCPADRSSGDCLMRYEKLDWNRDLPDSEAWEEPALVVREGLESLQFLYSDDYGLIDTEWREKWKPETQRFQAGNKSSFQDYGSVTMASDWPQDIPIPARVQIVFKKKDSSDEQWVFPVSQVRLKEWSPYRKDFRSFERWTPPKKKREQ